MYTTARLFRSVPGRIPFNRPTTSPISFRPFSASYRQAMLSTELSEADVSALKANKDRLAKDLHHSCQWGYGIRWGE